MVINRSTDPIQGSHGDDPVLARPVSQAWAAPRVDREGPSPCP